MPLKRRLGLVAFVSGTFLVFSAVIRIMLTVMTPKGAGLSAGLLLKAAATGLFFDLATLSYAILPLALYLLLAPRRITSQKWHDWPVRLFFTLFVTSLIFDACAEYLFFDEFGTRFNFIAVDYLVYTQEVIGNICESYPLVPIFTGIAVGALLFVFLARRRLDQAAQKTFQGAYHRIGGALLLPALAVYALVNVSQSEVSPNNYANELAGNGIYNLFAAFVNNELSFTRFYRTEPDALALKRLRTLVAERNNSYRDPGSPRFTRQIRNKGPEKHLNVIVVVEESLSAEYLGIFGNKHNLTPNLDRLAPESLLFTNLYAAGTRTVRGLEAISLSVPPLPGTSIIKRPNNGGFRSWGEIMDAKGYDSKFIYGGHGYFDNMNAFFSGNGFSIVDRTDMSKQEVTFSNIWGVCDEDLYRRVIREAGLSHAAGKPFFSMVMTTSNHRPYTYPDGRIDLPSKTTGRMGGVKYADYAIGRFIAEARHQPWFKDTVFVFVADHCASSAGREAIPARRYEIPMLVYSPAHVRPARVDRIMSQIDVAPTVLGLLNMSYDTDFLGRDILKESDNYPRAFISTYQKLGYLTEDRLLVLSPRKQAAQFRLNRATGEVQPMPLDPKLLGDMLAYYQGADYLYQHRLNRIR